MDNLPGMAYRCRNDAQWTMRFVSQGCRKLTGYPPSRIVEGGDTAFGELIHPDDRQRVWDEVQKALVAGDAFTLQYRIVAADGQTRWVWERGRAVGEDEDGVMVLEGLITDVTPQKQIEEELRRSREMLARTERICHIGSFEWDAEQDQATWSDHVFEMVGRPPSDGPAPMAAVGELFDETSIERLQPAIENLLADGEPFEVELASRTDGEEARYFAVRGYPRRDGDGRICGVFGSFQDITEARRTEREREELQLAVERSAEAIVIADESGGIRYVNRAFTELEGVSHEEATAMSLADLLPDDDDGDAIREALASARTWQGRISRQRGRTASVYDASIAPVQDDSVDATRFIAVFRDISQTMELEGQLRQAQKMEAIGRLAGGVAHDFNNILQALLGYAELLRDHVVDPDGRDLVDDIAQSTVRASELTRQLLAFGRRQVIRPERLDLNEVVADVLKLVSRTFGAHIQVDFVPGHRLARVWADRGMMEQVLMNLCLNARDAMPDGGTLSLETQNVLFNGVYCSTHAWARPGRWVLLTVSDTGIGMDEETAQQIFEPFFTTKPVGQGTGLGLATVYGIVRQHDGMVQVYSEPGKGTAFKVYLPVAERLAREVGTKLDGPLRGGRETILMAEDDPSVRMLVQRVLERAGYQVIAAKHGEDAVDLYEANAERVDMLLLDVVMPVMDGRECYERVRAQDESIPVLFMSGYSENAVHTDFVLHEGVRLIQKPVPPEELLRAVRATLDARRRRSQDDE